MPPMRHSVLAGGAVVALWAGVSAGALGLAPLHAAMAHDEGGQRGIVLPDGPPAAPPPSVTTVAAGDAWSQSVAADPRVVVRTAGPSREPPETDADETGESASAGDLARTTDAYAPDGREDQGPAERTVEGPATAGPRGPDVPPPVSGDPPADDSPASF